MEGRRRIFLGIIVLAVVAAGYLYYTLVYQKQPAKVTFDFPKTTQVSSEFSVPLKVSVPIATNAAEFYFSFPNDLIEVKSIDTTDSIFQLWITDQPSFDNKKGLISFAGGLPTPGFTGNDGLIATVKFKVKKAGSGQITLDQEKSRILANDGEGTEIDSRFQPINFKTND